MIASDAIELIQETAVKAADPLQIVVKPPAEPAHIYYTKKPDGTLERKVAEGPLSAHQAYDTDAIATHLKERPDAKPEVWYSRFALIGIVERNRATLTLKPSAPFAALVKFDKGEGNQFTAIDLYKQLRTTFYGALPSHSDLPSLIETMKFRKEQTTTSTVNTSKVSMAKDLQAEVVLGKPLPEVLTFDVPVFDSTVVTQPAFVKCAFYADPEKDRLVITPLPGEIERAWAIAERQARELLVNSLVSAGLEEVPIYYGNPSN